MCQNCGWLLLGIFLQLCLISLFGVRHYGHRIFPEDSGPFAFWTAAGELTCLPHSTRIGWNIVANPSSQREQHDSLYAKTLVIC
jgi:hypothetical protein